MRILGIDLGSSSIKAVELDSAFGRYEIHEYHETALSPGDDPYVRVAELVQSLSKTPDRIAVAVRTGQATFRNLQLPTRDRKSVQAAVGFEMDDELPFPSEQALYDYAILSQSKGGTLVHAAATLRKHIEALLGSWKGVGIDPDLVTTEAWAYRTFVNRMTGPASQPEPVMVVNIGHERSVIYVQWKGQPFLAREIPWGGRELTLAICQRYKIPLDQAERAKLDHGFVIPNEQRSQATAEQVEFSSTLLQPLMSFIADLRQAKLTAKNSTHANIKTIYLAGGSSLLPGLPRVIEESLQTEVRALQSLSAIAPSGVTYSEPADAKFLSAGALALCLVGSDRAGCVSFRKGDYSKQGRSREFNATALRKPLQALAAISACMFLSLTVQSFVFKSRLTTIDTQLEKGVRSFFGQLSASGVRTYLSNVSALRTAINRELTKNRELKRLSDPNPRSSVDFLKELSSSVPKDLVVDMIQYQVGSAPTSKYLTPEDSASLTFVVANQAAADRLASIISPRLVSGIQKGKLEEVPAPDGSPEKRWKITFTGKIPEDAYGK